jgi:hypothetical protein
MGTRRRSPRYLYRVYDYRSVSQYDRDDGFLAGAPDRPFYRSKYWARKVLNQHMDWANRIKTPFISTTKSFPKTVHYARQREGMGHGGVRIAKIDSHRLPGDVKVYHMQSLVVQTHAYVEPPGWNKWEYLILGQIPADAVMEILTLDDGE